MTEKSHRPLCIVLSSPSGGGKTTLCSRLLVEFPAMVYSISCTTRPPRPGEKDGEHYYFLTEPEFKRQAEAGVFLEYAQVHDHWYGTPQQRIEQALRDGRDVLLDIDVQGAGRIRKSRSESARRPAHLYPAKHPDPRVRPARCVVSESHTSGHAPAHTQESPRRQPAV